jgi:hypothetical protein
VLPLVACRFVSHVLHVTHRHSFTVIARVHRAVTRGPCQLGRFPDG